MMQWNELEWQHFPHGTRAQVTLRNNTHSYVEIWEQKSKRGKQQRYTVALMHYPEPNTHTTLNYNATWEEAREVLFKYTDLDPLMSLCFDFIKGRAKPME